MEDFLTSFFVAPFTGLATGIASATSPLDVIDAVDGFVWGPIMILLLLFTHIFMTVRTGFIQRKLGTGIKMSVIKDDPSDASGDITQFGALTTALAATIGTGNIVGVGTGLLFGGPGAIFWMWITGILGIATKYSEVFIGVKYRVKDHSGKMLGGAMYALERGFRTRSSVAFSLSCSPCSRRWQPSASALPRSRTRLLTPSTTPRSSTARPSHSGLWAQSSWCSSPSSS